MLCDDRPGNGKESCATGLARELSLGSDVEESEVSSNKVMCDTGGLVQDVDLTVKNVFCLLVCVLGDVAGGSCLDAVES